MKKLVLIFSFIVLGLAFLKAESSVRQTKVEKNKISTVVTVGNHANSNDNIPISLPGVLGLLPLIGLGAGRSLDRKEKRSIEHEKHGLKLLSKTLSNMDGQYDDDSYVNMEGKAVTLDDFYSLFLPDPALRSLNMQEIIKSTAVFSFTLTSNCTTSKKVCLSVANFPTERIYEVSNGVFTIKYNNETSIKSVYGFDAVLGDGNIYNDLGSPAQIISCAQGGEFPIDYFTRYFRNNPILVGKIRVGSTSQAAFTKFTIFEDVNPLKKEGGRPVPFNSFIKSSDFRDTFVDITIPITLSDDTILVYDVPAVANTSSPITITFEMYVAAINSESQFFNRLLKAFDVKR